MESFVTNPQPSWADEVDMDNDDVLPQSSEYIKGNYKYEIIYRHNEKGQKEKVERTYRIERKQVPKSVAKRRNWKKFGDSANDERGPNSQTTGVSDEIFMESLKQQQRQQQEYAVHLETEKKIAKCRICGGQHWSVNCAHKDTAMDTVETLMEKKATAAATALISDISKQVQGKYVPPSLRDGKKSNEQNNNNNGSTTIRITNLSESVTEDDLKDLVMPFGHVERIHIVRNRMTGLCLGNAHVTFKYHSNAARAIAFLHDFGYDHLILKVDWSQPRK